MPNKIKQNPVPAGVADPAGIADGLVLGVPFLDTPCAFPGPPKRRSNALGLAQLGQAGLARLLLVVASSEGEGGAGLLDLGQLVKGIEGIRNTSAIWLI